MKTIKNSKRLMAIPTLRGDLFIEKNKEYKVSNLEYSLLISIYGKEVELLKEETEILVEVSKPVPFTEEKPKKKKRK